jgi:hypothetical protein
VSAEPLSSNVRRGPLAKNAPASKHPVLLVAGKDDAAGYLSLVDDMSQVAGARMNVCEVDSSPWMDPGHGNGRQRSLYRRMFHSGCSRSAPDILSQRFHAIPVRRCVPVLDVRPTDPSTVKDTNGRSGPASCAHCNMKLSRHLAPNRLTAADPDDADYTPTHPPKSAPSGPLSSER